MKNKKVIISIVVLIAIIGAVGFFGVCTKICDMKKLSPSEFREKHSK